MENADVFGSSTAPLTWHDFLERMRQPSASDFVKAIKSFIVSFLNNTPDPDRDSASVQEFLTNMEAAFRAHSLWAGCSEEELDSAGEGLEKYVMTKLYTRVFASLPDDVKVDEQLHEKMALIQQFIRPENLDILPTYQNETSWLLAQKELQKINMYKAPRDKLVCILNCCKVISNLLLNASLAANKSPPGADEFLPVLIYVTIKANPPQLHSNLLYIQRYRRQSRLVAEAAYFFTNMLSAESFVLSIDGKALSMDDDEFERNVEFAQALVSGLSSDHDDTPSQSDQSSIGHVSRSQSIESRYGGSNSKKYQGATQTYEAKHGNEGHYAKDRLSSFNKIPSISDLENRGATMIMKEEKVNKVFREFPYLYSQSGDLTVSDVDNLLNNYKQLVFKYVSLATGMGVAVPSPPLSAGESLTQNQVETVKELKDTREVGLNNETQVVGTSKTNDDSNGVEVSGAENPEAKLAQEEDASLAERIDEISSS